MDKCERFDLLNYKNVQILLMTGARKVELSKNKEKIIEEYTEGNKTKLDNTGSILDIINKLLDRSYFDLTDLESRLVEKINVKEVRKEEGVKDNGTLLIFNFRR
jgi:hypothetical protein